MHSLDNSNDSKGKIIRADLIYSFFVRYYIRKGFLP